MSGVCPAYIKAGMSYTLRAVVSYLQAAASYLEVTSSCLQAVVSYLQAVASHHGPNRRGPGGARFWGGQQCRLARMVSPT